MLFLLLELLHVSGIRAKLTLISGRSHDTEEFLLGIKEAEWSKLLDDQDFLEPTTSTENNLLESCSVGRQKESEGADGANSCHTSTKCKRLKLSLSRRKPSKTTEVKDGCTKIVQTLCRKVAFLSLYLLLSEKKQVRVLFQLILQLVHNGP